MKDLLSKIYDYVINYEDDSIKLGSKFDAEVKKAIEPLKESMTAEELECIKGIVYSTAYAAEKNSSQRVWINAIYCIKCEEADKRNIKAA